MDARWPFGSLIVGHSGAMYAVQESLGQGGTAVVFRVTSRGQSYAAKALSDHRFPIDEAAIVRFARSNAHLRRVRSPHVLRVVDTSADGDPVAVFSHLTGGSLYERLASDSGSVDRRLRWITDMLRGVAALHQAGLVHRDLSPRNLLHDDLDRVVVADFGTVRHHDDTTLTGAADRLGSLIFISPEQLEDPHRALPADDVYSVGQIAFQLLGGVLPHGNVGSLGQHARELQQRAPSIVKAVETMRAYRRTDRPSDGTVAVELWMEAYGTYLGRAVDGHEGERGRLERAMVPGRQDSAPWRFVVAGFERLYGSLDRIRLDLDSGSLGAVALSDAIELQERIWEACLAVHAALACRAEVPASVRDGNGDRESSRPAEVVVLVLEAEIVLGQSGSASTSGEVQPTVWFEGTAALVRALCARRVELEAGSMLLVPRLVRRVSAEGSEVLVWPSRSGGLARR